MENSRDDEWMKELEGRLRKYTEQPDDVLWSKIAASTESKDSVVAAWWDYAAVAAVLVLIALVANTNVGADKSLKQEAYQKTEKADLFAKTDTDKPTQPEYDQPTRAMAEKTDNAREYVQSRTVETHIQGTSENQQEQRGATEPTIAVLPEKTDTLPSAQTTFSLKADSIPSAKEQEKKSAQKRKRPLLFAQISPALSYWHIQPHANDALTVQGFEPVSILSGKRLGMGIEAGVQVAVKKWDVFGGISGYYQNQALVYMVSGENVVVSEGSEEYKIDVLRERMEYSYEMLNVGVTAGFLRTISTQKLKHKIGLSLAASQGLLQAGGRDHKNATSAYIQYAFLYRVEYPLSDKIIWYMQPVYSRPLFSSTNPGEPFTIKPSHAGITLGVTF